ncbi:MAG: type I-E CRISPR-associated protein Cse1/CasA, partial [Chloroflexi bacterium]|nr:type I-E CRISPR-associated protein Cse1/CasA [Chloroflexota bacterium]
AKVYFYQQERLPLPSIYLADENLFTDLQLAMNKTEDVARTTRGAVSRLAELVLSTSADQQGGRSPDRGDVRNLVEHWGVMREYWGSLEPFFWEFVSALPHDPDAVLDWWMGVLKQIAEATFQRAETLAGTDARALKAAVVGRQQLNAGLKKLFKSGQEA